MQRARNQIKRLQGHLQVLYLDMRLREFNFQIIHTQRVRKPSLYFCRGHFQVRIAGYMI